VVYDAPNLEDSDLFLGLTVLCEGRARTLIHEADHPEKQTIVSYVSDSNENQKQVLTNAGYLVTKHVFNLHRDLTDEFPTPTWPDRITQRAVNPGEDVRKLHALIQTAFDKPGRSPQPFGEWKSYMMHPDRFIPELWFLIEAENEIIGCCLCFEYPNLGWVRQLAVRADRSGSGLGRKLLQHAFHSFKMRGFPKVGLAVEGDNETACSLYQSAGMQITVHLNEFSKIVS